MEFRKVTAIVRHDGSEKAERKPPGIGAREFSVTRAKGYGEYTNFYRRDWRMTNARVEIFASAKHAQAIAQAIMDVSHSGIPCDGIVAVLPVEQLFRIRTKSVAAGEIQAGFERA